MNDVMQVASTRKANLESEIQKRESEIADMRAEIETLDEFMAYGKDLIARNPDVNERPEEPAMAPRPASQPSPKLAETLKALNASNDDEDDEDDFDDEDDEDDDFDAMAEDEELAKSIAQLRPRTRPISRPA